MYSSAEDCHKPLLRSGRFAKGKFSGRIRCAPTADFTWRQLKCVSANDENGREYDTTPQRIYWLNVANHTVGDSTSSALTNRFMSYETARSSSLQYFLNFTELCLRSSGNSVILNWLSHKRRGQFGDVTKFFGFRTWSTAIPLESSQGCM